MRWLLNLSIKYKILSISIVGAVGFAAYLVFNAMAAVNNAGRMASIRDVYFPVLEKADQNVTIFGQIRESMSAAAATADEDLIYEADSLRDMTVENLGAIDTLSSAYQAETDAIREALATYYDDAKSLTMGMVKGTLEMGMASSRIENMNAEMADYEKLLTDFSDKVHKQFTNATEEAESSANEALIIGIGIGIVLLLLLGGIGAFVAFNVTANINNVVSSLKELAAGEGDLRRRLESKQQDEIGQLVQEFNGFVGNLQGLIQEIVGSIAKLSGSAEQMMLVTEQSNQGVRQQQTDVDQVATAMNEMTATVQEVARNTAEAASAARETSSEAESGRSIVNGAVNSINMLANEIENASAVIQRLAEDSDNIGTVLDVIKSIAEQTNLLALNAAIEAARAGEQGRGFAVVADEVRTLAQRTQQSTQEIQEIIEKLQAGAIEAVNVMNQSRTQAQSSVDQSNQADTSLVTITEMISRINDMNTQIASAAEEQSAVAEEVNRSIVAISQVSDQTAQNSQQIAVASEEMTAQTGQLHSMVSRFKV